VAGAWAKFFKQQATKAGRLVSASSEIAGCFQRVLGRAMSKLFGISIAGIIFAPAHIPLNISPEYGQPKKQTKWQVSRYLPANCVECFNTMQKTVRPQILNHNLPHL
jgi:hypothetical protein